MKTYTVLFAEDVPHYGTAEVQAENDSAAIEAAKSYDLSEVTNDPEWGNSVCKRIVDIQDAEGNVIADDISLDDCFLRYGGDEDRALCDASAEMLHALEAAEEQLAMYGAADDGRDTDAHQALENVRAALASAKKGGNQ